MRNSRLLAVKKLSFRDKSDARAVTPSSEESRTPTPTTSLRNELEEKKERMKKKLKRSGGDDIEDPRLIEYRKKKKQMKEATPRKSHSTFWLNGNFEHKENSHEY